MDNVYLVMALKMLKMDVVASIAKLTKDGKLKELEKELIDLSNDSGDKDITDPVVKKNVSDLLCKYGLLTPDLDPKTVCPKPKMDKKLMIALIVLAILLFLAFVYFMMMKK